MSSKAVDQLRSLYTKYNAELRKTSGMGAMMWRAVSPTIPELLTGLEGNPDILLKALPVLKGLVEAIEDDTRNEKH